MIEQILERFDAFDREGGELFTEAQLNEWPGKAAADLKATRLLMKAGYRKTVTCLGCEQACLKTVLESPMREDQANPRFFIACEEYEEVGRIPVDLATLEQWQFNIYQFVRLLASALSIEEKPEEIVPRQVFDLGRLSVNQRNRSIIFAVNQRVFSSYLDDGPIPWQKPVFLIGAGLRVITTVGGGSAIPLSHILLVAKTSIEIDMEELESLISSRRPTLPVDLIPVKTPKNLRWEHVIITFVNPDVVQIKFNDFSEPRSSAEIGFADSRGATKPLMLWKLLFLLAEHEGVIKPNYDLYSSNPNAVKKSFSRLSEKLTAAFPNIIGKPLFRYQPMKGYRTKFRINKSPNYFG